ncbi:MAG: transposase [Burkholderia sp.]
MAARRATPARRTGRGRRRVSGRGTLRRQGWGRGAPGKTPFVAAMQTSDDGRPLFMRLSPVPGFTKAALEVWAASSLMPTACVVSDGLWCFDGVTQKAASHGGMSRAVAVRPRSAPSSAGSTRCSAT